MSTTGISTPPSSKAASAEPICRTHERAVNKNPALDDA
jgi:hypothetical protein